MSNKCAGAIRLTQNKASNPYGTVSPVDETGDN
jgi:hypothetical protein